MISISASRRHRLMHTLVLGHFQVLLSAIGVIPSVVASSTRKNNVLPGKRSLGKKRYKSLGPFHASVTAQADHDRAKNGKISAVSSTATR